MEETQLNAGKGLNITMFNFTLGFRKQSMKFLESVKSDAEKASV